MTNDFDKAYWEDRYRGHTPHDSHRPNPQLEAEVAGLTPGAALEAGCGEGANAVWLAQRGWQVTAMDISATALRLARQHAETVDAGATSRISWVEADILAAPPATEGFDLVTSHYVHPTGPFDELIARLADAVAPGGTLLVVGHGPGGAGSHEHDALGVSFTAEEIASFLDQARWEVQVAETRTREDTHHGIEQRDTVLRARRRG